MDLIDKWSPFGAYDMYADKLLCVERGIAAFSARVTLLWIVSLLSMLGFAPSLLVEEIVLSRTSGCRRTAGSTAPMAGVVTNTWTTSSSKAD